MNINSARLIYFSPTRTTKKVIENIAQGIQIAEVVHVDLTPPEARTKELATIRDGLAVIGFPVYAGRLPADAVERFRLLKGHDIPAVIVVVYGNRAYEDALLELRDLAVETGFRPIAAGAFIGEHSYSSDASPIAVGRPDTEDLGKAQEFGKKIREKIIHVLAFQEISPLKVPGNFPYKERSTLSNISPVTQETVCSKCGECASVCPTAAIGVGDSVVTDCGICIRCCACVKACPAGARTMAEPRIKQVAEQLSVNCRERKEPETFL